MDEFVQDKAVKFGRMTEVVAEEGHQKQAKRDQRHHRKVRERAGEHQAVIPEEIDNAPPHHAQNSQEVLSFLLAFTWILIGVPSNEKFSRRPFSMNLRCDSFTASV
jgi:hypothetical protein